MSLSTAGPGERPALAPLAALFAGAASLRAAAYRRGWLRQARLSSPVVSVGNLAVGGRGKTPAVELLARELLGAGLPVSVLSRGYRGSFSGECLVVSDGERLLATAAEAGDEPAMLGRSLPGVVVAVGPRRDAVGRAVEARFGPRVHLLDDGFQHLRLARDLDVVCLEPSDLRARALPAGPLREPPSALGRARVALVADATASDLAEVRRLLAPGGEAFAVRRRPRGFLTRDGGAAPAPRRAFLLAGIARPERLETDVTAAGAEVAGRAFFADHHVFTAAELAAASRAATAAEADAVVTTAKDAARLGEAWEGPLPLLVLAVGLEVDGAPALRERLLSVAGAVGRKGAAAAGPVDTWAQARARRRARRYRLEAALASAVEAVVSPLPRRAVLVLGRGLGRLWGALDRRHRAIAADNLRRAFPDWDEPRVDRTARGVYAHFGAVLLDILWLSRRSREEILGLVDFEGLEHYRSAMATGRGAVFPTAHVGNWELHGVAHSLAHGPVAVIARPLDNPALDARLCAFRSSGGNEVLYKRHALAGALRRLRAGGGVAVLVDQNVQARDGIFVDFFSRPAATTTVAAALAVKTGCALVPVRTELRPDGRYRLVFEAPVEWQPGPERQGDVALLTQRVTTRIEAWVRERPEQWLWIHRRWKTRPPGERP